MKTIKKYVKLISSCSECPSCYQSPQDNSFRGAYSFTCDKVVKEIQLIDLDNFPEWCPLENAKICPMCFEEEVGVNTNGLCEGCFKANQEEKEGGK